MNLLTRIFGILFAASKGKRNEETNENQLPERERELAAPYESLNSDFWDSFCFKQR